MAGKTKNQGPGAVGRSAQGVEPGPTAAVVDQDLNEEQLGKIAFGTKLLPDIPADQYTAEWIILYGLEQYYLNRELRSYYRQLAEQQTADDVQREILAALDPDSVDPDKFRASAAELSKLLGRDLAEVEAALAELLAAGALRNSGPSIDGEQLLALNTPLKFAEPLRVAPLPVIDREDLISEVGVAGTYQACGQVIARQQRAKELAIDDQERALIDRLVNVGVRFSDYGSYGLRLDQLVFNQELSQAEHQEIVDRLERLVEVGAICQSPANDSGPDVVYQLPALPEIPEYDPSLPQGELFPSALRQLIAKHGVEEFYRRQGRIEYQRQQALALAANDRQRQLVNCLADLQQRSPALSPFGFDPDDFALHSHRELGLSADEINKLLVDTPLGTKLFSGPQGQLYLSLLPDQYQPRSIEFTERLLLGRRAQLLREAYGGISAYQQAVGQGTEIRRQLVDALRSSLPDQRRQKFVQAFDPGIIDPEQRWVDIEELKTITAPSQSAPLCRQLVRAGILEQRTGAHQETEFALADTPSAALEKA